MAGKIYNRYSPKVKPSRASSNVANTSKYTFIVFLGIFELGSLLCGIAISSKMLIVARAISGMGGSGLVNGALTIVAASVPLENRATYLGIMMGSKSSSCPLKANHSHMLSLSARNTAWASAWGSIDTIHYMEMV